MKKFTITLLALAILAATGTYIYAKVKNTYAYDTKICTDKNDAKNTCLSTFYKGLVKKYGIPTAISDLKKRAGENATVSAQCHPLAHAIGQAASEQFKDVSSAYMQGDPYCWSGYYHGVIEGIAERIGADNLPKELNTICANIPDRAKYGFDYYNCVHGLGHGIMELKGDDVFTSLGICDNLTGAWEKQSCQGGVFMENVMLYERYGTSEYLKPSDPLYPCTAVKEEYKYQCYLGQTSFALKAAGYNFKTVSDLCATVKGTYRDICNQSLGRDAANQARHDASTTKNTCYIPTDPNDRNNCITGAVKEFISFYHSDKESNEFCAILNEENKSLCASTGANYYQLFTK